MNERRPRSGASPRKMLDGIETVGNKVPHPAIIFLGPLRARDRRLGDPRRVRRSASPTRSPSCRRSRRPIEDARRLAVARGERAALLRGRRARDPHRDDRGQEPAVDRRHPLHLLLVRHQLRQLQRGGGDLRGHDRRRRGREGRADGGADPQARAGRARAR